MSDPKSAYSVEPLGSLTVQEVKLILRLRQLHGLRVLVDLRSDWQLQVCGRVEHLTPAAASTSLPVDMRIVS